MTEWKMVPVVPAPEMLQAGQRAWLKDPARLSSTLYRAMLDAAPPAPVSAPPAGDELALADARDQIEFLSVEIHRLRRCVATLMVRLTNWLDDDQFNEADGIVSPEFEPQPPAQQADQRAAPPAPGIDLAEVERLIDSVVDCAEWKAGCEGIPSELPAAMSELSAACAALLDYLRPFARRDVRSGK